MKSRVSRWIVFAGVAILIGSHTAIPFPAIHTANHVDRSLSSSQKHYRLIRENFDQLCRFADKGQDCWVELDKDGKVFLEFKEVRRNCDFVELFDPRRGYQLRLHQDARFI